MHTGVQHSFPSARVLIRELSPRFMMAVFLLPHERLCKEIEQPRSACARFRAYLGADGERSFDLHCSSHLSNAVYIDVGHHMDLLCDLHVRDACNIPLSTLNRIITLDEGTS